MPPCRRMNASAIRSSSTVVTPGSSRSPTCAIVSATSAPARAIFSISAALLRMITRPRPRRAGRARPRSRRRPRRSSARRASGDELPRRPVALDHRLGLLVVDREPACDHLRRVVRAALLERRARASAPSRRSSESSKQEHGVERPADLGEHRVERLRLGEVAREAVEHEPVAASARRAARGSASIISSSGTRSPRSRIGSTRRPSSVPSAMAARSMSPVETCGIAVVGRDPLRLRPLAGALRPEHEQVQHARPPGRGEPRPLLRGSPRSERIIICDSIWRIVSSATPTAISTDVPPSAPRARLREAAVADEEARERPPRPRGRASRAASGA